MPDVRAADIDKRLRFWMLLLLCAEYYVVLHLLSATTMQVLKHVDGIPWVTTGGITETLSHGPSFILQSRQLGGSLDAAIL